jgi:hypothetical protein
LVADASVYTLEPTGEGAPPFKEMLAGFDKDKNGRIELTEVSGDTVNEKIMYRLFKSIDKIDGNGDGVLTQDEWDRAFNADNPGGSLGRSGHP